MDSDGEDKVEDIMMPINDKPDNPIRLARRSSRTEE